MKVYVITGEAGSYDDTTWWNEEAFLDETKAKERLAVLEAEGAKIEYLGKIRYSVWQNE